MTTRDLKLNILCIALGLIVGFSMGVVCQGRASDAGAIEPEPLHPVVIDQRISGGSFLQQAAADWLLIIRPDFNEVVTEVRFVPKRSLFVNSPSPSNPSKARCFTDDQGNVLPEGWCVGEAIGRGRVRMAQEYQPDDIQELLRVIAHEYAHHVLWKNCQWCTTDEHLADQCALDPTKCGRTP